SRRERGRLDCRTDGSINVTPWKLHVRSPREKYGSESPIHCLTVIDGIDVAGGACWNLPGRRVPICGKKAGRRRQTPAKTPYVRRHGLRSWPQALHKLPAHLPPPQRALSGGVADVP